MNLAFFFSLLRQTNKKGKALQQVVVVVFITVVNLHTHTLYMFTT